MKRLRFAMEWLALAALVLLAGSGAYDVAAGVRTSAWYIGWYGEHYGMLPVSSIVFTYALGVFRGTVTLCCAAAGLAGVMKGRIRLRYFLLLGMCAYWYVGALVHNAYKGSPIENWMQMWIAVFCLFVLGAYKLILWRNSKNECAP